ncbi:MAG: hypothetical protein JRG91_01905 [Deltaproteobacteria bacterium]|nr:hypothetical protein [Deltaproteobacteria bacterium]
MTKKTAGTLGLFALFLIIVHACTNLDDIDLKDPRLGELGLVKFEGPGCSSSTTMAVGSTVTMTVEPEEGALPDDLSVRSSEPAVINAAAGATANEVLLEAHQAGETHVEMLSAGDVYDWLGFDAEPAAAVLYTAQDAVFAGGAFILKIDEVHGACGEECPLIGSSFIDWSTSPTGALTLDADVDDTAIFTAGATGSASIIGDEPSERGSLVDHAVTIADPSAAGALDGHVLVYLPDETLLDPQPAPVELPVGSYVQIQLFALAGGTEVPVSRFDAVWDITGDAGTIQSYDLDTWEAPEGPVYEAMAAGTATISADSGLLGSSAAFDITVTE